MSLCMENATHDMVHAKDNLQHLLMDSSFLGLGVVVFNDTFINILVISWRSALLVEEIGLPGENHQPVVSH